MHQSVLLEEVVALFKPLSQRPQPILIDCTLGLGGHSLALLQAYPNLHIVGIDRDKEAQTLALDKLTPYKERFTHKQGNFAQILPTLPSPQGILADLGVSSLQLDNPNRGFGFNALSLDMRMDTGQSLDAFKVVNGYSLYELERVLQTGEVREYKKIASLIVQQRHKQPFNTAQDLANFLAKHTHRGKLHPATLVFQAIRMEVNAEMQNLQTLLEYSKTLQDTLLCVIAFHSLEDRQVKHAFREYAKTYGEMLTKKPITPSPQEVRHNPRARSAKMRAFHFKALWCPPNP
ncbi:16S rRNA (cytosine(1402)-N(4))-methyltransferase RsmH [Helicobacter heilmannii]|uniref:Ribosomal RNA small subunit methyltransferase H n=4 Tax=Helicobacter heilmannii TaxID=35817 RepID=A0A0K2YAB1_HELHE|nr:16S rRNA (cytosine(1402)-N(4))-methyltransferase RsmH [Helicobacter heilmannii]BDQ26741.1 ribosomal RNA small subunit methyltransferase H [Helicobacter heilmannii]CCM11132.1 rRNA small subunit methyltransferase H [Helicobacter heilmannii ASB1.4]CRI34644.1 rRNA small subunit methyltransferase H [Helicobacter heilmannii]